MTDTDTKIIKPVLWSRDFILAFAANLLMFFSFYLLLPILPLYVINDLHASESIAGVVLSLYTVAALVIRPFSGFMVDAFSRKPLYLACYTIFAVVFAGYVVASTLTLFIIVRIVHGFAFGTNTVAGSTLAIDLMPAQRRGEGIGYFGMASSIAMAMGPMVGLFLYNGYSFNVIFMTSFTIGMAGLLLILPIRAPEKVVSDTKEVLSLDRFILLKGVNSALVLIMIGLGYGIIANYIGIYSTQIHMTGTAGLFFTLQAVGIVGARLLSAGAVNKGRLAGTVYIGSILLFIGYLIASYVPSAVGFYISAFILGLGFGYIMPPFQTMFIDLAEHNRRGTANSTYYISWDFGIGAGIAVGGYVIETVGFSNLFIICAVVVMIGLVYFRFVAAPYFERNKVR